MKTTRKREKVRYGWYVSTRGPYPCSVEREPHNKLRIGTTTSLSGGRICVCSWGYHASERLIAAACHAWSSLPGVRFYFHYVKVWGEIHGSRDKFCGRHRQVLRAFGPFGCREADVIPDKNLPLRTRNRLLLSKEIHDPNP